MDRFVKIESDRQVHVLYYFRKSDREKIDLVACDDVVQLREFADFLNNMIGYVSGLGIYSQSAHGYYAIRSTPLLRPDELFPRLKEIKNRADNTEY